VTLIVKVFGGQDECLLVPSLDINRPWHFGIKFINHEKATIYVQRPDSEFFIYKYSIVYNYTPNSFSR